MASGAAAMHDCRAASDSSAAMHHCGTASMHTTYMHGTCMSTTGCHPQPSANMHHCGTTSGNSAAVHHCGATCMHSANMNSTCVHTTGCHPEVAALVQQRAAPLHQACGLALTLPPSVELLRPVQHELLQLLVLLALGA